MTAPLHPSAREFLTAAGYTVLIRNAGWCECLLTSGEERWRGRGPDEPAALDDALRQMFPSRLARDV